MNNDKAWNNIITHKIFYLEPYELCGSYALYDHARPEGSVESVRIIDGLICGDATSMTDFSEKFEQLLRDINQIKVDSSDAKAETKVLATRLNGTVQNMDRHLMEAEQRQQMLNNLWRVLLLQIILIVFATGGIVWMVRNDNERIDMLSASCTRFMEHIIIDETRWQYFKIEPKIMKGGEI